MDNRRQSLVDDQGTIVAGPKVGEASKLLSAALDSSKELYDGAYEQAVKGAKLADQTIRKKQKRPAPAKPGQNSWRMIWRRWDPLT